MNVLSSDIGGRLREVTSGVDRSQAVSDWRGSDPIKEIGQTCGLNVIVRHKATSNRSVVTAAKLVYSNWKINQPRGKWKSDISESTCIATGSPAAFDGRTTGRM